MTKIKNFFKSITNSKKKVFALALSVCVVVLSIASSSIAYFTDTAKYTNTFTSGKVGITLTVNGTDVATTDTYADSGVYPGEVIKKNTVITSESGSQSAYFGAIITVTDTQSLLSTGTVDDLFAGLPTDVNVASVNVASPTTGTYKIYVVYAAKYTEGQTATVFTDIAIPSTWTNEQMGKLPGVTINVDAYAVQSDGFADGTTPLQALQAAFKDGSNPIFPTP